jgi:hypothetical protein
LKIKRTSQSAKLAKHEKAIGELYAIVQILAKKIENLENPPKVNEND